jgi:hypothetical protein
LFVLFFSDLAADNFCINGLDPHFERRSDKNSLSVSEDFRLCGADSIHSVQFTFLPIQSTIL